MKLTSIFLLLIVLFSCQENNETTVSTDLYEITIQADLDLFNVSESGRIASDSSETSPIFTDLFYSLHDSLCNEIDSDGRMIYDGELPSITLPNLSGGKYYYSISAHGGQGIRYDTASSFVLESDTTIDATLKNKQMRYRFIATSSVDSADVYYVNYQLNYTKVYFYNFPECSENGEWSSDQYEGHYDANSFSDNFQYENPIDLESVHVKFYDYNENVVKSYIIPLTKKLEHHHSYTFEIDLSAIWSDETEGNSIQLYLEDIEWTEDTVDLNG